MKYTWIKRKAFVSHQSAKTICNSISFPHVEEFVPSAKGVKLVEFVLGIATYFPFPKSASGVKWGVVDAGIFQRNSMTMMHNTNG